MNKRYTPTERKGVNTIEEMVLDFKWIFREQPIVDMGVDAHIEVCEDSNPTGRLIALQIKTGKSWLKKSSNGYVYRGKLTHLNYWKSHSLPVIVVICDNEQRKAWWSLISDDQIVFTPKAWKITIPYDQYFDASSVELLKAIALLGWKKSKSLQELTKELSAVRSLTKTSDFGDLQKALKLADKQVDILTPFIDERMFSLLKFLSIDVTVRLILKNVPLPVRQEFELYPEEHPNLQIRQLANMHSKVIIIDKLLMIYGSASLTILNWRGSCPETYSATTNLHFIEEATDTFEHCWSNALELKQSG